MNIALIGCGKMGKEVERIASARRIAVKKVFTSKENSGGMGLTGQSLKNVDVCIDFSAPSAVLDNIKAAAACGKNIVVGTTGWYDSLDAVKAIVAAKKIGLLYSPNFSLGMNILFQVLAAASDIFNRFELYDVAVSEVHHSGKADSPSGTALMLGQIILQHVRRKKELLRNMPEGRIRPDQLHVTSTRVGQAAGSHRVLFDSEADSIELVHVAKDRSGFALGALIAAEWLRGKKGLYTMKDVLTSV